MKIKSLISLLLLAIAFVVLPASAGAQEYKMQTFTVGLKGQQEKAPVEVSSIFMAPAVLSSWDLKSPIEEGYKEKAAAIAKEFTGGFVAAFAEKGVAIAPTAIEGAPKGATIFVKVSYKNGQMFEAIRIGFWMVTPDKKLLKSFLHEAIVPRDIPVDMSAKDMAKAVAEVLIIKSS